MFTIESLPIVDVCVYVLVIICNKYTLKKKNTAVEIKILLSSSLYN